MTEIQYSELLENLSLMRYCRIEPHSLSYRDPFRLREIKKKKENGQLVEEPNDNENINIIVFSESELRSMVQENQPKPDINMSDNSYKEVQPDSDIDDNLRIIKSDWVWPNGSIPFIIDETVTVEMKLKLYEAMHEFAKTPITFYFVNQCKPNLEPEYVKFYRSMTNTSYTIGCGRTKNGGEYQVFLLESQSKGTYIHEIMHILGFEHEHCRQDRDQYLKVMMYRMSDPDLRYQYEKKGFMLGNYDPYSIMHYPLNKHYAIYKGNLNGQIGQRVGLSEGDIKGINYAYGNINCTYDAFPEQYYSQSYYECIDCWCSDSSFGVCVQCAVRCHKGHNLIFHDAKNEEISFACDYGKFQHRLQLCTRGQTKQKYIKQILYLCFDCFDIIDYQTKHNGATPGVCISCFRKCHANHNAKYMGISENFFCDCGLASCRSTCKAQP